MATRRTVRSTSKKQVRIPVVIKTPNGTRRTSVPGTQTTVTTKTTIKP